MQESEKVKETIDKLYEIAKEDIETRKKFTNMTEEEKNEFIKQLQKKESEEKKENKSISW